MNDISIKKAAFINMISKYFNVILYFIFTAILSRLLSPTDFGIVAVMSVFVTFFQIFSDMGIGTAIIQNQTLSTDDINNIFSFSIYLAIVLMISFCGFSYLIAWLYKNNVYISLGYILSISIFFTTLNIVPNSILMKNKKFIHIAIRTIGVCILTYFFTIILAFLDFKYYTLVIQSVISNFILLIWNVNTLGIKLKIKLKFNISSLKKIYSYSLYQFAASFLNYFQRNLDNLLVGKFMGAEKLGYYNKGYTLSTYPVSYLSNVITPVLHPIFADHQDDVNYIYRKYIVIVRILSLLGCFISAFFFFASEEIIFVMFGSQWGQSVIPFKIISLCIWPQMITSTVGCIFQSINKTKELFKMCCMSIFISIIGIVLGVCSQSLSLLAIYIVVIYYIHFVIYGYFMMRLGFNLPYYKFLLSFKFETLIFIVLLLISSFVEISTNIILLTLFYKFLVMFFLFLILLVCTKQIKLFINIFK